MKHRAFTLLEILIVITILGIVSATMASALISNRAKEAFDADIKSIVGILEQARIQGMGQLVFESGGQDYVADYYEFTFAGPTRVEFYAHALHEEGFIDESILLEEIDLNQDYQIQLIEPFGPFGVYYDPITSDVCFGYVGGCYHTTYQTLTMVLGSATDPENGAEITVAAAGGHIQVEYLDLTLEEEEGPVL